MLHRRLNGLETACLALESAHAPLHTAAVLSLDASAHSGIDHLSKLMDAINDAIEHFERLRFRIVSAPLGLAMPDFEDAGRPDLEHHLTRIRVPKPGGPRQLGRIIDEILSRPLARGCPLFEMHLVEGLASGAIVLVIKLHLVPIDGITAWHLGLALSDLDSADSSRTQRSEKSQAHTPEAPRSLEAALTFMTSGAGKLAHASASLLGAAATAVLRGRRGSPTRPTPPKGSRLNAPVRDGRCSAHATLRAGTLEDIAKTFSVSPDDVVLASITGALRDELAAAGEIHNLPLVALVVRDEEVGQGPRARLPKIKLQRLPAHIGLAGARLRMIRRDQELGADLLPEPFGDVLIEWADATAPAVFSLIVRAARDLDLGAHLPLVANLIVSFGRDIPLQPTIGGIRIEHLYPHGPAPEGINLHVAVQRMGATVDIGVTAAGDVLPDPWRFTAGLGDALHELSAAALAVEE